MQVAFLKCLEGSQLSRLSLFNDINKACGFIMKTKQVTDQVGPMKQNCVEGNNQNLFNDEIHQAIANKDNLFSIFNQTIIIMMGSIINHVTRYRV